MAILTLRNATYLVAALGVTFSGCQSDDDDDDGGGNGGGSIGGNFVGKLFGGGSQNGGGQNGGGQGGGGGGAGGGAGGGGGGANGGGNPFGGGNGTPLPSDACGNLCVQLLGCIIDVCGVEGVSQDDIAQAAQSECAPGCEEASDEERGQAGAAVANNCAALRQYAQQDASACEGIGGGGGGGGGGGSGDCASACSRLSECGADVGSQGECVQSCESQGLQEVAVCVNASDSCDDAARCLTGIDGGNGGAGGGVGGGGGGGNCNTAVFCQAVNCGFECGGDEACATGCAQEYCGEGARDCTGCGESDIQACFGQ